MLTEKAAAHLAASAAVPMLDAPANEELSGVSIAASGEATPVVVTASGATPGLAAGTGEVVVTSAAIAAAAQDGGTGGRAETFSVTLNQDSFFGFYPAFNGLIPVSENVDFSFYGIIWTTDAFGNRSRFRPVDRIRRRRGESTPAISSSSRRSA